MSIFKNWKFWVMLGVVVLWARMPWFVQNNYQLQVLFRITLFAALGLAWNLVGGYAGQLSLGHVAFFGVGAYGLALFTELGVPVWISVFLAAVVATTPKVKVCVAADASVWASKTWPPKSTSKEPGTPPSPV